MNERFFLLDARFSNAGDNTVPNDSTALTSKSRNNEDSTRSGNKKNTFKDLLAERQIVADHGYEILFLVRFIILQSVTKLKLYMNLTKGINILKTITLFFFLDIVSLIFYFDQHPHV